MAQSVLGVMQTTHCNKSGMRIQFMSSFSFSLSLSLPFLKTKKKAEDIMSFSECVFKFKKLSGRQ